MSALPEGWVETSLGEVTHYASGKIPVSEVDLDNYISTENLLAGKLGVTQAATIPKVSKVNAFAAGDTLFSNIRTYFKKVWYSDKSGGASNDVLVFRPVDEEQLDKKYLYYLISNDGFIDYTVITAKGTKMPRGDKGAIKQYPLSLPPLLEQKSIADMLSSFDDKIELLREQNKTLETLAQTIFKEWFVNFNYPDATGEMVDSELGEIPKGWRVSGIRDLVEHVKKNIKPFDYPEKEYRHFSLPAFDSGKRPELHCGNEISSNKYLVVDQSFLVSKLNPGTPRVWTVLKPHEDSICSTEFQVIKPKHFGFFGFVYGALTSYALRRELSARAHGTSSSHQRVNPADILDAPVAIPSNDLIVNYSEIVNELLEKIDNNLQQVSSLSKTRDALLPKLMSGKVRV